MTDPTTPTPNSSGRTIHTTTPTPNSSGRSTHTPTPNSSGRSIHRGDAVLDARIRVSRGGFNLDVALTAGPGEVVGILGPNGGGKTSTVLALAGVLPINDGHIEVAARVWDDGQSALPPERRSVGLMLADSLLFPHLSAAANIAYGPRSRGAARQLAHARAVDELDRVGLADRARSKPHELSSGQAARVALARALATDPALLLLDEPLSALDPDTRARTRSDLGARLAAYDGVTVLVTHDPLDALTLADSLVFIEDGKVTQQGTPHDVLREPRSPYVGTVVGLNLYAAQGDSRGAVAIEGGGVLVTTDATEGSVWATVPPSAVSLHRHEPEGSARNTWRLRITDVTMQGQSARVGLAGEIELIAEVTLTSVASMSLTVGQEVWAAVKATEVRTYRR